MSSSPISKKTLITLGIVILLAIGYFYFMGSKSPQTSNSLLSSAGIGVGAAESSLLNQIKMLQVDTSLFKDPKYAALVDYSVAIQPSVVGRPNPFENIPGVPSPFSSENPGAANNSASLQRTTR